ncbi:hypothetical protein AK812_SmicGene3223 [Symbiodinium microadriaticum]|uniref:Uncharacterized protein n=1 Tax=Symbiodinium microadriaticum TaxID=2951 RepID=A0A1Q9EZ89_SYMMI|nr:hypothetical protein AK812_SmicGene3223 [Symbiodinium microadriaticum]CAE7176511.1 unnamed protein product [Symbiodinium microadriaticum]
MWMLPWFRGLQIYLILFHHLGTAEFWRPNSCKQDLALCPQWTLFENCEHKRAASNYTEVPVECVPELVQRTIAPTGTILQYPNLVTIPDKEMEQDPTAPGTPNQDPPTRERKSDMGKSMQGPASPPRWSAKQPDTKQIDTAKHTKPVSSTSPSTTAATGDRAPSVTPPSCLQEVQNVRKTTKNFAAKTSRLLDGIQDHGPALSAVKMHVGAIKVEIGTLRKDFAGSAKDAKDLSAG